MKRWHIHVGLGTIATAAVIAALAGAFSDPVVKWATVEVGGHHGVPVTTITVPATVVKDAKASAIDGGMRNEAPAGAPLGQLNAAKAQQEKLAATDQLPIVTPLAAPEQRGCRTMLVQNYSTRFGVRPRLFVLHYTVSGNRPGWDDVNAIVTLFNDWAFQASSNYVIDNEGHCAYIVRESDKAWTQAAYNPDAISVEVINTGSEPTYAGTAGLAKIGLVASDALCRWKIPVQQGATSGGLVVRPGIVDHKSLGIIGGGHSDIGHYSVPKVILAVQAARAKYGCGRPPVKRPVPKLTRRQQRAVLRTQIRALRTHGQTWSSIFATPVYRRYVALGGR